MGRLVGAAVLLAALVGGCTPSGDDAGADPTLLKASPDVPALAESPTPTAAPSPTVADESAGLSDVVLAWTRNELPDGYADAVRGDPAVGAVTVVAADTGELVRTRDADGEIVDDTADGFHLPLEVLTVDAATYDEVVGSDVAADLDDDEVLLSDTSAEVRGLDVGATLTFADGAEVTVAGVVADALVGAGEVIVTVDSPLAATTPVYLLARPAQAIDVLMDALAALLPADVPGRVHTVEQTPILRHADAVLAPARMKARYGEFAMRDGSEGRGIAQDEAWFEASIVAEQVPILGEVTCHRDTVEAVRSALGELEDRGLSDLVDPGGYAGCWNPRRQAADGPLSSHAWGVAIDLNARANPQGGDSQQDPRLVEAMADHGFTWGGDWLLPDPMHFELAH